MKTNREYKRMINNIEDLCSILTASNRDVTDFVQQARGALRFYKLLIAVNEEVGDMTELHTTAFKRSYGCERLIRRDK